MLNLLKNMMNKLQASEDLEETLQFVVQSVSSALEADYAAIFLVDNQYTTYHKWAFSTSDKKIKIPNSIKLRDGIVGLVSDREESIRIDNLDSDSEWFERAKKWEQACRSFLGVPIISQRELLGILFLQNKEPNVFTEKDEALLLTLSLQLAELITQARVRRSLEKIPTHSTKKEKAHAVVTGVIGAGGIAIGKAVVVHARTNLRLVPDRPVKNIEKEVELFKTALKQAREEIDRLKTRAEKDFSSVEQALFEVYSQILKDRSFINKIIHQIKKGHWAQGALRRVVEGYVAKFESLEDTYLRDRVSDFRDLANRILFYLQATERKGKRYPRKVILVGEEITTTLLMEVPRNSLVGFVSTSGSVNSHVAILSRTLGIVAIMGVEGSIIPYFQGKELILDGYTGHVYVSPPQGIKKDFTRLIEEETAFNKNLEKLHDLPAKTTDDTKITLYVNAGLAPDASYSLKAGAEGVGLFRTEMPFMIRDRLPSEDEQSLIYHRLLHSFAPRPVIMRTLDIGGDKNISYLAVHEDNPFLGWRGIRITLDHPDLFVQQVKAMLRASEGLDNLAIMLPMITSVNEVDLSLELIQQAYQELLEADVKVKKPKIGIMIEVPAVIYQIKELSAQIDFFSIGSNDLTQYLLAVDRNNARVANLYQALHPAVLRALYQIAKAVQKVQKPLSICGGLASDPLAIILLLGMGIDTLSVNPRALLKVKSIIRHFSIKECENLLGKVLLMDDPKDIYNELSLALEEKGLSSLIRAGK